TTSAPTRAAKTSLLASCRRSPRISAAAVAGCCPGDQGALAERIPGARLQQQRRDLPHLVRSRGRAVQDGRERGGGRSRVVLAESICPNGPWCVGGVSVPAA